MPDASAVEPPHSRRLPLSLAVIRDRLPKSVEVGLAVLSAILLILAFPNFDLWWLAWAGLTPLVLAVTRTAQTFAAFLIGLLWGTIFFYGTCWWLTYPMIHYGRLPSVLAYPLLFLPVMLVAVFPGLACVCLSRIVARLGHAAIFTAPLIWVTFDWLRYVITGQVWNALGYSQAFHPSLIHPAAWGGVYAVTFFLVAANTAVASLFVRRTRRYLAVSVVTLVVIVLILVAPKLRTRAQVRPVPLPSHFVVAVQPNVPMDAVDARLMQQLLRRHIELSQQGLADAPRDALDRLVVWPESPMNFSYSRDPRLQNIVASFAREQHTAVLLNSLEPAPNAGGFNSALLINEEGGIAAQYDKIRLMPFGEYVPLPRWLPGSGSVRSIVGEFTPGSSYTLMPLGDLRAGVFICVEAVHPAIARTFTNAGADVLINISNDGYLGPTAVMRQHLANAIFRAVENDRELIRVTNTGISAHINADGSVTDSTTGFQEALRTWTVSRRAEGTTFYTRHGDLFVYGCALISLGIISATFMTKRKRLTEARP